MKKRTNRRADGTFGRKLEANQKVMYDGLTWRVCKAFETDRSGHIYYDIQRGRKVESVRTDYLKPVSVR